MMCVKLPTSPRGGPYIPPGSEYAPEAGYGVVPTRRAKALVEYLLSLKINYSLPEAPILE